MPFHPRWGFRRFGRLCRDEPAEQPPHGPGRGGRQPGTRQTGPELVGVEPVALRVLQQAAGDHRREIQKAAQLGAEAIKGKEWSDDELDAKAEAAKRVGLRPPNRWTPERGGWTADEVARLATDHDKVIAQKLGRTPVTFQRTLRKIPAFSGNPGGGPAWTAEELALLGTDTDAAVAERIGRTTGAVAQKRAALNVPAFRKYRRRTR